jgi:hypothetical protein
VVLTNPQIQSQSARKWLSDLDDSSNGHLYVACK